MALDGVREPVRVRFAYHSDSDIQDLCHRYGYAQVVEGEIVEGD